MKELCQKLKHYHRRLLFSLILAFLATLALVSYISSRNQESEQERRFNATVDPTDPILTPIKTAQTRWQTRSFTRYRMVWIPESNDCQANVIVENEIIVRTLENTCLISPKPVTKLLNDIYQRMTHIMWVNGVGCDLIVVHATFNKLGYPETVRYQQEWMSPLNVGHNAYEKYQRPPNIPCTLLGVYDYGYSIELLVPILGEEF